MSGVNVNTLGIEEIEAISHLTTLRHAAEISPLILERTIGPDIPKQRSPKCPNESSVDPRRRHKRIESKINVNATPSNVTSFVVSPYIPELQNLDLETINASVRLHEAEQQRRTKVYHDVVKLVDRHSLISANILKIREQLRNDHNNWLAERQQRQASIVIEAERLAKKTMQENEKDAEVLRRQTQRQLQMISFQGIAQCQSKFRMKYENVAELLVSIHKQALLSCEEYNKSLKELVQHFEHLIAKIKGGECGASELLMSGNLCRSLDNLENSIIRELENIVKREEQGALMQQQPLSPPPPQQQQQQQQQQHVQQQQQQHHHHHHVQQQQEEMMKTQNQASELSVVAVDACDSFGADLPNPSECHLDSNVVVQEANVTTAATMSEPNTLNDATIPNAERGQFYREIIGFYHDKVDKVKPLQMDENFKKFRSGCQRAINIPVNAISGVNSQHLKDKFEKLYSFISGHPLKTPDGQISINDHPLGRDYCVLLMAKKFVSQGDTAVSSNPQAAFPVASVIVSLWKTVSEFGPIFLAYTFKESPFLVPHFVLPKEGQPIDDYYKELGYRVTNGQVEQQNMYLKRQSGIARLYAAVMITHGRQQDGPDHPYYIDQGWRWLANFVFLEPLPDISATLLLEVLQTIGADMWNAYGKQFLKLLVYIQQHYFPKLSAVDVGGPKARLELLLGKFLREGKIPQPQGILPTGFW